MTKFNAIGILILSLIAFAPVVDAGCCSGGTWDPSGFLNSEIGTGQIVPPGSAGDSSAGNSGSGTAGTQKSFDRVASFPNGTILKAMKSVSSSDVVMDVSNTDSYSTSHIKNAIHIPSKAFLNGEGNLKTNEELAKVLGDAGVSRDDSIVLYAGKESSGEAEFAFLVLSYLGQKDVQLLDGSLGDWKASGLPEETSENILPGTEYGPMVKPQVIAEYQYVKSGQAQIIDVRPFVEFGKGRIPGSIALDPANVIKGDKIKTGTDLGMVFSRLDKEKPIVVYSDDYSRSALVWYALQLMGYEASIYTWEDWKAHKAAEVPEGTAPAGGNTVDSKYTKLGTT
ncbi:MAG: rhodanese-like domain-containing protein [Methanothrix sp.]|nr:rhodanese-like domain-containing protein [Methanothrix sp.]